MVTLAEKELYQMKLVALEYERRGCKVVLESRHRLPDGRFMVFDLVAINNETEEMFVVEVVNRRRDASELKTRVEQIATALENRPNVKIDFRYIDDDDQLTNRARIEASESTKKLERKINFRLPKIPNIKKPSLQLDRVAVADWWHFKHEVRALGLVHKLDPANSVLNIYNELLSLGVLAPAEEFLEDGPKLDAFQIEEKLVVLLEGGSISVEIAKDIRKHLTSIRFQRKASSRRAPS
ncbi:hypothetical protein [Azohydromonas lata]|uniref:REase AHJR-like domain-containing protein n=1 Tax=Azohydromonas lata TaxID=45677 RepID=A0ABU5IHP2_9BURK|nr:hypothetical protein [Azohydromonas lata]MDZ5458015.1 hypothetical protein [Azohydromonas lata]